MTPVPATQPSTARQCMVTCTRGAARSACAVIPAPSSPRARTPVGCNPGHIEQGGQDVFLRCRRWPGRKKEKPKHHSLRGGEPRKGPACHSVFGRDRSLQSRPKRNRPNSVHAITSFAASGLGWAHGGGTLALGTSIQRNRFLMSLFWLDCMYADRLRLCATVVCSPKIGKIRICVTTATP